MPTANNATTVDVTCRRSHTTANHMKMGNRTTMIRGTDQSGISGSCETNVGTIETSTQAPYATGNDRNAPPSER